MPRATPGTDTAQQFALRSSRAGSCVDTVPASRTPHPCEARRNIDSTCHIYVKTWVCICYTCILVLSFYVYSTAERHTRRDCANGEARCADAANPAPYRTKSLTRETRTKHVPRRGTPTATRASTHTSACGTTHSTTALAAARHLLTLLARGRAARAKSAAIVAVAPTVRLN